MVEILSYDKAKHRSCALAIFKSYPDIFAGLELKQIEEELNEESTPLYERFVATLDGKVVGFSALKRSSDTKHSWAVYWLAVDSNYSGQGIGTQLVEKVIEEAKTKNTACLYVETCGCEDQISARKLYEKCGFKKVGEVPDYYEVGHPKVTYFRVP